MKLREHPGLKVWPPQWGVVVKTLGREHPNADSTFNSQAILRRAYLKPYNADAIEVEVGHASFEGTITGTVLVAEGQDTKTFMALLDGCRGFTIAQTGERELSE
jgi:hypothetical protein